MKNDAQQIAGEKLLKICQLHVTMIAWRINAFIIKGKNNLSIRGERSIVSRYISWTITSLKSHLNVICKLGYMYVHLFNSLPGHGSSFSSFGFKFMFLQNEVTNCMSYCLMCEVVQLVIAHLNLYTSYFDFCIVFFKSGT